VLIKTLKFVGLLLLIAIVSLFGLREVYFVGPTQQPITSLPENIIDIHSHVAGIGAGGTQNFVSSTLQEGFKFKLYLSAFNTSLNEITQKGDQVVAFYLAQQVKQSNYVQHAVILALDGVVDAKGQLDKSKTQIYIDNDFVAQQAHKYEELYFGASINPYRFDAIERLKTVKKQGAKLIKWIPNIQLIDPADEKLIPFYKMMVMLNLPLLTHTGQERAFAHANDKFGDPERLKLPLKYGVTVIAAHIGTTGENDGEANYQRLLPMLERYDNLYTDLSSLTQLNKLGYLNDALKRESISQKIMYGSDYPLSNTLLVSAFNFPLNLTIKQMFAINSIKNHWDRDIKLKQALGVSSRIFSLSGTLLNL